MYSVLGMILGPLTDRFGPRIVLIFGSACLGLGIGLLSQVEKVWHVYIFYGLLASWGMGAVYITSNPTIVKWFVEKRGLALGVAQSGQGMGIILLPPFIGSQISAFGWRPACIILGGLVFLILFPSVSSRALTREVLSLWIMIIDKSFGIIMSYIILRSGNRSDTPFIDNFSFCDASRILRFFDQFK